MKREKQIELIQSAEARTRGYLSNWMLNPKFKEAVRRQLRTPTDDNEDAHYVARVRKRACA